MMASYTTQMYDALGAEIPSIAVAVGLHVRNNKLNEFAGIVMLRMIMGKFDADTKVIRDDLMLRLKQVID